MSLDLDADVLITEEAPITALIQRMGRCNRKNQVPQTVGEVYVYPPDDPKRPYTQEDLTGVEGFLKELASCPAVGQSALEEALNRSGRRPPQADPPLHFVVRGPYAEGDKEALRDFVDFGRRATLDEGKYQKAWALKPPGLIVPVPPSLEDRR